MKKYIVATLAVLVFSVSCSESLTFKNPQPEGAESLSSFPTRIRGNFFNNDGESSLTITENAMVCIYDFDMKCHKDSLPDGYILRGDTLITLAEFEDPANNQKVKFESGNYIIFHQHVVDTVFKISGSAVLKAQKGYYFLNEKVQTDTNKFEWDVRVISLSKGVVNVSYINARNEIDALKPIVESPADSTTFLPKTTEKRIWTFRDEGKMDMVDTFYRQR